MSTMPIVLIGSLTLATLNLTGAVDVASAAPKKPDANRSGAAKLTATVVGATVAADSAHTAADDAEISTASVVVPAHYTVRRGDTVSGIATHYRLSTASVLALNGLSWKSTIFPGQVLKLTKATATTPSVPQPSAPATTSAASTRYTIRSGDTITAIAKKFGVTVAAVLTANNLNAKSIIYAGRTLIIPSKAAASSSPAAPAVGTQPSQVGTSVTPLSPAMKANALTIIAVGKAEKVPDYGVIIALAAAAQESGLLNLSRGDLDSVGLFQQRPSAGWGTKSQLEDTTYASELFFGGPSNPNRGKTRGLLDVKGWQSMTLTQAAQAVQVSAHPTAYAKWETSARAWFAALS
jgi:LysM repeat protein